MILIAIVCAAHIIGLSIMLQGLVALLVILGPPGQWLNAWVRGCCLGLAVKARVPGPPGLHSTMPETQ